MPQFDPSKEEENRNKVLQYVQDLFDGDDETRAELMDRFGADSSIWEDVDPGDVAYALEQVEGSQGESGAAKFLEDMATAADPMSVMNDTLDAIPTDGEDSENSAKSSENSAKPKLPRDLGSVEGPRKRRSKARIRKQAEISADKYREQVISDLNKIDRREGGRAADRASDDIVANTAAQLHAARFQERYDPRRVSGSGRELYERHAMIDTLAERADRIVMSRLLAQAKLQGKGDAHLPDPGAVMREAQRLEGLSVSEFSAELKGLDDDAEVQAIMSAGAEWSDKGKNEERLASLSTEALSSQFGATSVETRREGYKAYSELRSASEADILQGSMDLQEAVFKERQRSGQYLAPVDKGNRRLADRIAGQVSDTRLNRGIAAYAAAAGDRYGFDPERISGDLGLQQYANRAASIELLAGGLVGRDRSEFVERVSDQPNEEIEASLERGGFSQGDVDRMRANLAKTGESLYEGGAQARDIRRANQRYERSQRRAQGISGFASTLRQVGLDVSIGGKPYEGDGDGPRFSTDADRERRAAERNTGRRFEPNLDIQAATAYRDDVTARASGISEQAMRRRAQQAKQQIDSGPEVPAVGVGEPAPAPTPAVAKPDVRQAAPRIVPEAPKPEREPAVERRDAVRLPQRDLAKRVGVLDDQVQQLRRFASSISEQRFRLST